MADPDFSFLDPPLRPPAAQPVTGSAPGAGNRPILLPEIPGVRDDGYDEDQDESGVADVLNHAPAWLASAVLHMLMLIVLGLLAVTISAERAEVEIEVASADQVGVQLDDPSVLQGDSPILENPHDEQVLTPKDLPLVDDPLAAPLEIGELQLGNLGSSGPSLLTGPATIEGAPIGLALKGREVGTKRVLLGKYGGTAVTEQAVDQALNWLVKQQRSDGSWSLSGPYADGCHAENVAAATAMALLAFQGHGDTHRTGSHAKVVKRGWQALLKMQRKNGLFSGTMNENHQILYTHAQCAIALCELYGMTNDSAYREPAERAIAYALEAQDKQGGGWRYQAGFDSDTSVTGWFVMALQSARMAGLSVPKEPFELASRYLDSAQLDDGRRYGYWKNSQPSNAVSAEGLLCRQYLGWRQSDPRLVEGITALVKSSPIRYAARADQLPELGGAEQDVYYWYYATQVAHHMEGPIWDEWNKVMREEVPKHQVKSGPEAGSWDPQQDKWGPYGGRLYVTCLSTYMLEVYYRHLPIYSGYRSFAGGPSTPKATEKDAAEAESASP